MTRILRLLLIAAVAWPMWQSAAAQEAVRTDANRPLTEECLEKSEVAIRKAASNQNGAKPDNHEAVRANGVQSGKAVGRDVKTGKSGRTSAPVLKGVRPMTDVPSGYALVVFVANDVWQDGSGYQMLLDQNATMYDTWYNNGTPSMSQNIYNMAEFTIPENADYNSSGNVSNMLIGQTGQVAVPAGTYDILITNPTPGSRIYVASNGGNIGGRIDNYTLEAGKAYTFTVSMGTSNDKTDVEITSLSAVGQPTGLTAVPDNAEAKISWVAGQNNEGWNLRYRPYPDPYSSIDRNRIWDFEDGSQAEMFTKLDIDGDGYTWERVTGFKANSGTGVMTSASFINNVGALTPNNWLISPKVKLGGSVSFYACGQDNNSYYQEKFRVYVYQGDTWTSVNQFTALSNRDVTTGKTMTKYEYDLSAYSGVGYIAIRHYNCTDQFYLNVDDIEVLVPNPEPEPDWIYVNDVTNPYTITGLTNGTTYEVQVQGVGNGETSDWTNSVYFTPFEAPTRDIVINDADFFEGITYDWVDDNGVTQTSDLTEIATTPKQMIAMFTKIYTDPTIPGNLKRGFDEQGRDEAWNDCYYSGVGQVWGSGSVTSASSYYYSDNFGWNIPGDLVFNNSLSSNNIYYTYMDTTQYRPNQEGLTLILVEIKDDFDKNDLDNVDWSDLETYFAKTLKSARVITEARRTGDGLEAGTLFKIDCDKMNKFFLLAKGQVCWKNNSFYAQTDELVSGSTSDYYIMGGDFCGPPAYIYWSYTGNDNQTHYVNQFCDYYSQPLFYHMFEQFSPNAFEEEAKDDLYALMVGDDMKSFGVVHDCASVEPIQGHGFLMYGKDSPVADCQDVRDMMFFVPDYRMMKDATRDTREGTYKFSYYNVNHQPIMGMYVIRQDEITPTTQADDYYMLQLNWRSNLDDFLPSNDQEFELLQIVVDDNGNESYVPVYYMNAQGQYTDAAGNVVDEANKVPIILVMEAGRIKNYPNVYVQRQETSQQVTYAIRGRDAADPVTGEHFLSLQISNRQSYIVPGLDPSEIVLLEDATHYSRFDAERVRNCYSNKLTMENDLNGIKQANLTSSTQLTITRQAQGATEPTTIATVTFDPSNHGYTVQMFDQAADENEFPECADHSRAGYHANNGGTVKGNGSWSGTYTENTNGTINLGTLEIFDNFVQAIPSDNSHPNGYFYNVTSNYECDNSQPISVYLNPGITSTGDEIWYAWTWNNDNDGKWLLGTPQAGGILKFGPAKNNIIFARMNPAASNVPSFDGATWNRTGDLSTVGYMGKTFTLYGWDMTGYWAGDVIYDQAHSNTFRIPVYKTSSQISGSFSLDEVNADTGGALGLEENIEFGVGVQLSSKTEILRYDTYRWGENDPRYIIAWADGDDEQDLPPTGLAMNQGDYYTISMNPDTNNETNGETSVTSGSGTATFVDEVPNSSTNAAAYTYAPVVEAFTNRGDYNTYGGPLQSTAVGKMQVSVAPSDEENPMMSSYSWTGADGNKYAYYNFCLQFDQKSLPDDTYEIYKIRAWREVPTDMQGEEYEELKPIRMGARVGFEDITYPDCDASDQYQYHLGSDPETYEVVGADQGTHTYSGFTGTFGARKLRTDEPTGDNTVVDELDMNFVVRIYFTKKSNLQTTQNGAPLLRAEGDQDEAKYFIVEQTIPHTVLASQVITGVIQNLNVRQVVSEKYYNVAGVESDTPFKGVNIVVTRYSDGSTSTVKVLK